MDSHVVSVREAARQLGVHENTVRNWMDAGTMAYRTAGSWRRPLVSEVARLKADPPATRARTRLDALEERLERLENVVRTLPYFASKLDGESDYTDSGV
jgi:excisionase family DNA binding protein